MKWIGIWAAAGMGLILVGCGSANMGTARGPVMAAENVRSFGAIGDGKTKDTNAFQKAIDAAAAGGGEVVVPAGNYLIGSITLASGVTLRLQKDAIVTGSADADDYPLIPVRWEGEETTGRRGLVYAENAQNVAIVGPGSLVGGEGMGLLRDPRGPVLVEMVNCTHVRLDGFSARFVRLWTIHLLYCQDVTANNLSIRTAGINSDGIDVDSSTQVRITNCDIQSGDDCIALKSGRGMAAARIARPTQNVLISDCRLASSIFSDVAVGTEMSGGVRDVRIQHCTFARGTNGIFIKSRTGRGGFIENISTDDIDCAADALLAVELTNRGIVGAQPLSGLEAIPAVKNIRISHARVKCQDLVNAYLIAPEKPVDGLTLADISGTCRAGISLANIVNAHLSGIDVKGYSGPLLTTANVNGTGLEGAAAGGETARLAGGFENPPDNTRPLVRWWWFGPAVTHDELEREMKVMRDNGSGGFEIQPTYPLTTDASPNLRFLSPQFLEALHFVAAKAKELGLRMDLTMGSGWPYGGATISLDQSAGRLRILKGTATAEERRIALPALGPGETLLAAFAGPAGGDYSAMTELTPRDNVVDIPAQIIGPAQVLFFVAGHTGMKVKRPALGAEGYVVDHQNAAAVGKFIQSVAQVEVSACGENPPHAIFCDSLESYGEDWTGEFLSEFQKRRGYDLRPLLPALAGEMGPKTREIRQDWGQTLTETFNDYFVRQMQAFAQSNNTMFRIQAYGTPSAGLYSYAYCDLPEGEGYQWHGFREVRYAASACHLLGVPVCSSETFTWIHSPVFRATPLDIKAEANQHFLQGMNQVICHGWPYTAAGVGFPGWSFYAAGVFDEFNPWFIVMPQITRYLQRVSFMLRQGSPANDVAMYLANSDAWADFTPGHISLSDGVGKCLGPAIVGRILDSGYNLDFFDDQMLAMRGRVDGGALAFGDLRFKIVILAGVQRIPLATLKSLEQFARNGGTLVATRRLPERAPGYLASEQHQQAVHEIVERLFHGPDAPAIFVADEAQLGEALGRRMQPDLKLEPAAPEVGFVHRHGDSSEIYFVANTGNQPRHVKATFRVEGMNPQFLDPMSGQTRPLEVVDRPAGGTTIALNLAPYDSTIIVWSRESPTTQPAPVAANPPASIDLSEDWSVQFGKDSPAVRMHKLRSWTDDAEHRNFSGVAVYSRKFSIEPAMLAGGGELWLTLGEPTPGLSEPPSRNGFRADLTPPVREAALVYVNGRLAGAVWCPPYRVEVSKLLSAGVNDLRIEVANTAVNFIAGHGFPNYDYDTLVRTFGRRFDPQDIGQLREPLPSGLMGPIVLSAAAN